MENNFSRKIDRDGYIVIRSLIKKDLCNHIINEIYKANNVIKHFDRLGNLRRIEKIYNKGQYLKKLNLIITKFLKENLKSNFIIFKDKFNIKTPKGEGFFAHYDGVFYFNTKKKKNLKGWYEYSDSFITFLIALDKCNSKNGTIELAKSDNDSFEELIKNTNQDGTPILRKSYEQKLSFKKINLKIGDAVCFKNSCPHRSGKNYTNSSRRILYFTYNKKKDGDFYNKYFLDKKRSLNPQKSLTGKLK